jgi:hypothetical protein
MKAMYSLILLAIQISISCGNSPIFIYFMKDATKTEWHHKILKVVSMMTNVFWIGHNPGLLFVFLLDITPWEDIYIRIMGLSNNPTCRKCGTEEETSVQILCACEALASLRHAHLCSFFLDPEDIRKLYGGPSGNLVQEQGSFNLVIDHGAQRACSKA